MAIGDYYFHRGDTISTIGFENSIMSKFAKFLVDEFSTLQEFSYIGIKFRTDEITTTPSLLLIPTNIAEERDNANQSHRDMRYTFEIATALRDPVDAKIMLDTLQIQEIVEDLIETSIVGRHKRVTTVDGHYDTRVVDSPIQPISRSNDNVITLSIGINVVFYVFKPRV